MTIEASLSTLKQIRSAHLRHHEQGVGRIARAVALALGREAAYAELLSRAAALHDFGKMAIADAILLKPGKLDSGELETTQNHTIHGADVLRAAGSQVTDMAAPIALHHHECWDGSGYPHGLRGEAIPVEARVASVSDYYYDALRELRPYKALRSHEEVMQMILGNARGAPTNKFDPVILHLAEAQPELFRTAYEALN